MRFDGGDNDLFYWQILLQEIEELQRQEEIQTPESDKMNWILILRKDNTSKVIKDWFLNLAPETYYDHPEVLSLTIDEYRLIDIKDNRAYYDYVRLKGNEQLSSRK